MRFAFEKDVAARTRRHRGMAVRSQEAVAAAVACVEVLEPRQLLAVGGGWTAAGALGEYYSNTTLSGTPAFSRRDVRVNFSFGTAQSPSGNPGTEFGPIGTDNYSIRWTGQVIPRFSETYTFKTTSDDGARLYIKPAGSSSWTTLVDNWVSHTTTDNAASYAMTAGQAYDVKLEYYEKTGNSAIRLRWSSPSTPEELIEPIGIDGISADTYLGTLYANLLYRDTHAFGREDVDMWGHDAPLDANGWPTYPQLSCKLWDDAANAQYYLGWYTVQYRGKASFTMYGGNPEFWVGNTKYTGTLPKGVGYNATTGITTFRANITGDAGLTNWQWLDAQRPDGTPGITDVYVMRPTSPGSTQSYAVGTVFTDAILQSFSRFTTERWLTANGDDAQLWSERKTGQDSLESAIALANATGKDLWITLPARADDTFIRNTALALRYGTDANGDPYTSLKAKPVNAPLNPNLAVHVEYANEIWNTLGTFPQSDWVFDLARNEVTTNSPIGRKLNYDGALTSIIGTIGTTSPDYIRAIRRYTAMRTVDISNTFRSVYGDAAMGKVVRPVLMGWYDNTMDATEYALKFIEETYPNPVNYYIWGGGDATYYSSADSRGENSGVSFANFGFESGDLSGWARGGTVSVRANGDPYVYEAATPMGTHFVSLEGEGSSITQTVTIAKDGIYGLQFVAAGRSTQLDGGIDLSADLDVYINGVKVVSQMSLSKWGKPLASFNFEGWLGGMVGYFGLQPQAYMAGQQITVQFVSRASSPDRAVYLDDIRLCSTDAIAQGMPDSGEATGQINSGDWTQSIRNQADYPLAFGLVPVAYEGGISLGGDFNITPLQEYFKSQDIRLRDRQAGVDDRVWNAGYTMQALGTYSQWPVMASGTASTYPITQGFDLSNNTLRALPENGLVVPSANLLPSTANVYGRNSGWSHSSNSSSLAGGEWFSWNVVALKSSVYSIGVVSSAGGTLQLWVDGKLVKSAASGTTDSTFSYTLTLTAGLHSVRVRNAVGSGAFAVTNVTVQMPGAPAAPTLNTATMTGSSATLAWSGVANAAGYRVAYGQLSGSYTTVVDVKTATSATLGGLDPASVYYFAVQAYGSSGLFSLESNEIRAAVRSTGPMATITFDGVGETGSTPAEPLAISGYEFRSIGNDAGEALRIGGPTGEWLASPTSSLYVAFWHTQITIERSDGQPFDLYSLDALGHAASIKVIGIDPSGGTISQIVAIPEGVTSAYTTITLDWVRLASVRIEFYENADGSGEERIGAVDTLVFNRSLNLAARSPRQPVRPKPTTASATTKLVAATATASQQEASGKRVEDKTPALLRDTRRGLMA